MKVNIFDGFRELALSRTWNGRAYVCNNYYKVDVFLKKISYKKHNINFSS